MDATTGLYLSPQMRPCGTFNFEHNFAEAKYARLLSLRDESGEHASRFPFAGGVASTQQAVHYALMFFPAGGRRSRDLDGAYSASKDLLRRGANPKQKSKRQKNKGV